MKLDIKIKIEGDTCKVAAPLLTVFMQTKSIDGLTPELATRVRDMVADAFAFGYAECQHDVRRNLHRTASTYKGEDLTTPTVVNTVSNSQETR